MSWILSWLINAAALYATAELVPGVQVEGATELLLAAVVIGLVNSTIRPLLALLTLPITVLTLGLFYFVLNGLMFYLAAAITPGFTLAGLGSAIVGALVMSIVAMLLHLFLKPKD